MNQVALVGNLARDPELRQTQAGTNVCRFTVAVNRRVKQGQEKQADFISCTAWGKTAEIVAQYFTKGKPIGVTGSIRTGSYIDKQTGAKKFTTEVWADNIEFVGSKNDSAGSAENRTAVPPAVPEDPYAGDDFEPLVDTELPF